MKLQTLAACALAFANLSGTPARAALTIGTNADIGAGTAAFGTAQRLLDWTGGFAPGTNWTRGSFGGPAISAGSFTDAAMRRRRMASVAA